MTAPLSSFDAFLYPITIVAADQTMILTETGGATPASAAVVTITAGTYYAMMDTAPAGYSSLYAEIETRLNAASVASGNSSTYEIIRVDASSSSAFGKAAGIRIKCNGENGTTAFTMVFSSGSWTLDPRILGFPAAQAADESSTANVITAEMTAWGIWIPPERASQKGPRRTVRVQGRSGGRIASRRTNQLSSRSVRQFRYRYIPAGHIFTRRNQIQGYATTAGLALNDDGNYFADLHRYGFAADADVFVIHDLGGTAADITAANGYEIIRIDEAEAHKMDDLASSLQLTLTGGEYYEIDFLAYVKTSTYIYD